MAQVGSKSEVSQIGRISGSNPDYWAEKDQIGTGEGSGGDFGHQIRRLMRN